MNKQVVVVLLVLLFVLAMIIWAIVAGGSSGSVVSGGKFRAKPGRTREKVRPIPSATQVEDNAEGATGLHSGSTDGQVDEESGVEFQASLEKTAQSGDAENGLQQLEDLLASEKDPDRRSKLLEAKADLMLRVTPPRLDEAIAMLESAISEARDPQQKLMAARRYAIVLERIGESDTAIQKMNDLLTAYPEAGKGRLLLLVQKGLLSEKNNDTQDAIQSFEEMLAEAENSPDLIDPDVLDSCRVAGFRLAQLFRAQGLADRADAVAKRVKRLESRLHGP